MGKSLDLIFAKVSPECPRKNKRLAIYMQAFEFVGGSWRVRTADQLIKSQLLYQLS